MSFETDSTSTTRRLIAHLRESAEAAIKAAEKMESWPMDTTEQLQEVLHELLWHQDLMSIRAANGEGAAKHLLNSIQAEILAGKLSSD